MKYFEKKYSILLLSFALVANSSFSQQDTLNKKRVALVVGTEVALYTSSMIMLNELWYKGHARTSFHTFNDNKEWLGMDKVGHFMTSYYMGRIGIGLMRWSGMENKKTALYGGIVGTVYLSSVEILDGYSAEWGFSYGDVLANTAGTMLVMGQQLAWEDQRILLKYSFVQSNYYQYRPSLLGKDLSENWLKDYNGQTYWLSVNPASFMNKDTKFPKWLNIAFGYGADGMTGGTQNPLTFDDLGNQVVFDRFSQYYLSFDVDLTRIKTKSKFVNTMFNSFGFLKIPAPTLEFSNGKIKGHLLGY